MGEQERAAIEARLDKLEEELAGLRQDTRRGFERLQRQVDELLSEVAA